MEESSTESTSKQLPISTLVHRFASKHKSRKTPISLDSRSKKNKPRKKKKSNDGDDLDRDRDRRGGESDGGDEREEIESRIEALQRIVPGGERLGVDKLFEETAGYIMALQSKVKAMRALENLFRGLEKEKAKFGG